MLRNWKSFISDQQLQVYQIIPSRVEMKHWKYQLLHILRLMAPRTLGSGKNRPRISEICQPSTKCSNIQIFISRWNVIRSVYKTLWKPRRTDFVLLLRDMEPSWTSYHKQRSKQSDKTLSWRNKKYFLRRQERRYELDVMRIKTT